MANGLAGLGERTGADTDPLAKHADVLTQWEQTDVDWTGTETEGTNDDGIDFAEIHVDREDSLEYFLAHRITSKGIAETTERNYRAAFRVWREHMEKEERHVACANERMANRFIDARLQENSVNTVKQRVTLLKSAYHYFAGKTEFPHPSPLPQDGEHTKSVNPIKSAHKSFPYHKHEDDNGNRNRHPEISEADLREAMNAITHVRDRAIIGVQLKLGARSREMANMKLKDVSLTDPEVREHYPDVATNPKLRDNENAIVIPANRTGNKSKYDRTIPLDDEARKLLRQYLLIRPDNEEPWLFLTKSRHDTLGTTEGRSVSDLWRETFWPNVPAERPDGLASHVARHLFTTRLSQEESGLSSTDVDALRGDETGEDSSRAANDYINTHYPNIKDGYQKQIYRLGIV